MKTSEIIGLYNAITIVTKGFDFPAHRKFNWALHINGKRLKPTAEAFDDQRRQLVKQYAKKDENGNIVPKDPTEPDGEPAWDGDNERICKDAIREIGETEISDIAIYQCDFEQVPETLPTSVFSALAPIFREPKEDAEPAAAPAPSA